MSRRSNSLTAVILPPPAPPPPPPPPGSESDLAVLAKGMTPGQTASFTMGNLTAALIRSNVDADSSILGFAARGLWDPKNRKAQFWGQGHNETEKLITWDDATNLWTDAGSVTQFAAPHIGHAYYHLALNPATGDLYLREYNGARVLKKPFGGSWADIAACHNNGNQVASGIEWHPGLNGGIGGLMFFDELSAETWNPNTNTWTLRTTSLGSTGIGNFQGWNARAGNFIYFGGGGGSNVMLKMDLSGTVTNAPSSLGPNGAGIWAESLNVGSSSFRAPVITHPDGVQLLMFGPDNDQRVWVFNGTSWVQTGSMTVNSGYGWFAISVPDYGVVVFVAQSGNSQGAPFAKVYKPTTNLAMAQYNTIFPAIEGRLSQGSIWKNGGADGGDWHDVQTTAAGLCCAVHAAQGTSDSIACLNNWTGGQQYEIQGIIKRGAPGSNDFECELHSDCAIGPSNITSVECLFSSQGNIDIVRWNGGLNQFASIMTKDASGTPVFNNGDQVRVRKYNSGLVEMYKGSTLLAHATSPYNVAGRAPGVGFDKPGSADETQFGLSSYKVFPF